MSDNSKIEWTDASWNPTTGCTKVSPGCDHCYAETFAERWRGTPGHYYERGFDVQLRLDKLDQPLRWKKPRRIFVNSMSDLFHDDIPDDFIADVFATMALAERHTFQVLTKRHGRMRSLLNSWQFKVEVQRRAILIADRRNLNTISAAHATDPVGGPLRNVWLGVSVENQQWADIRIPALINTPAAVRWVSAEPLLGAMDLSRWLTDPYFNPSYRVARCGQQSSHAPHVMDYGPDEPRNCPGTSGRVYSPRHLNWVVVGGESGPGARPMYPDWARSLRDQCTASGVPFFYKQAGQYTAAWGQPLDGDSWLHTSGVQTAWHVGDGHLRRGEGEFRSPNGLCVLMRRWRSKHDAGRTLDGRTWDEYPAVTS
jgi:protein gp37